MGNWAAGSLAIGLGVIPLIGGLAALFRAPGEEPSRELRMFRCVALAGLIGVGMYTAMKAAYLSTVFATRVEERNIIYVAPLLLVGTAILLERRRVNCWALAGATRVRRVPRRIRALPRTRSRTRWTSSSTRTRSASRSCSRRTATSSWTPSTAQWVLLAILARRRRRVRRAAAGCARATRVAERRGRRSHSGSSAWNLTGEISAAAGTNSISRTAGATLRHPFTWVDDITHQQPTIYLGEGEADQNPEWMLEFWNRSIVTVGSLDGSVGGPGPAGVTEPGGERHDLLDGRSGESRPPVRLRRRGLAVRRLRGDVPRQALLPRRRRHEGLASRPADASEPSARRVHRHLPGRLERRGRQRVLPLLRGQGRLAAHRRLAPELGRRRPGRVRCTSCSRRSLIHPTRQPALEPDVAAGRPVDRQRADEGVLAAAPADRFGAAVVVDNKFIPHQIDPVVERHARPRRRGQLPVRQEGAAARAAEHM